MLLLSLNHNVVNSATNDNRITEYEQSNIRGAKYPTKLGYCYGLSLESFIEIGAKTRTFEIVKRTVARIVKM